ncbi:hypothetical protein [Simplicispira suum]|uniref:Uncharacterized protein n=1 Tax=Simplicispira suum TaxID=2109915 RepID=A0A2S0N621_9BURK|nr:hypothetical protein [Simplicispira suum]AVO43575.1 hypothetical protein C6571_19330 [Simplicispira suum]
MNIATRHAQMVRDVFLHVELLLNGDVRELSEYDIQGMMFLAFRSALANSDWRADRETSGKIDCVVFENTVPRVLYEIKTYFKARERLRISDFQKDLKKLKEAKLTYPSARSFFFIAASKTKVKDSALAKVPAIKALVRQADRKWTLFALANGTNVRLRPSRRELYGRSVALTWEVK